MRFSPRIPHGLKRHVLALFCANVRFGGDVSYVDEKPIRDGKPNDINMLLLTSRWCCQRGSNSRPLPYQGRGAPSYCFDSKGSKLKLGHMERKSCF